MANAFKEKQVQERKEAARTELLNATSGGLAGREVAIRSYCQKTGEGRRQALNILESRSFSGSDFSRKFTRA